MSDPVRHEVGDAHARFVLAERWDDGPVLGWIGMNPSTAGAERTDPTWSRGRFFSRRWGFGGQVWVNPVPLRSPDPGVARDMLVEFRAGRAPDVGKYLDLNAEHLQRVGGFPAAWVVGWGDKGAQMNEVVRVHRRALEALCAGGARTFLSLGLTQSGNPKHLLARGRSRVDDDASPCEWQPHWRAKGPRADLAAIRASWRPPARPPEGLP